MANSKRSKARIKAGRAEAAGSAKDAAQPARPERAHAPATKATPPPAAADKKASRRAKVKKIGQRGGLALGGTVAGAAISWGISSALTNATQPPAAPPITVQVDADQSDITSMANLPLSGVLAARPGLASPRSCSQLDSMIKVGAAIASPVRIQLVIQDDSNQAVFINNMTASIVSRKRASGRLLQCSPQAVASFRSIQVNLDGDPPKVTYASNGHAIPFGFTLGYTQQEIFDVTAFSVKANYEFYLYLHYVVDGKPEVLQVDDNGKPFRATSSAGDPIWQWNYGSWGIEGASAPAVKAGAPFLG